MDLSSAFSDVGGAVSDLFSAAGAGVGAASYREAAKLSGEDAALAEYAGRVKTAQVQRQGYLGIGQTKAGVGNAGFSDSGSALDVIRSSTQQAALATSLSQMQTAIDVNGYKAQQSAELSQAQSAEAAQQGDFFGALIKGVGTVASLFL